MAETGNKSKNEYEMNAIAYIVAGVALVAGIAIGFFISRFQAGRTEIENREKAVKILMEAREQARAVELQAKDSALKITQTAEGDITRLRSDLLKEDERLQHRRSELDSRMEKLEQREQAVNKRQSAVDKRLNDIEKTP